MRVIEVTAKTVDQAIEKGLQMLGVSKEQTKVNIVDKGSMLKKAKIEMVLFDNEEEKKNYVEPEKPVQKNSVKQRPVKIVPNSSVEEEPKVVRETLNKSETEVFEKVKAFLDGALKILNINGTVEVTTINDDLSISISGDTGGVLIGHHGDTLDALQNILNIIVKNEFEDYHKKVFIDVEGYRIRRTEALENLACRMASKVIQMQRSLKLEPMNSYERRVVHTALQNIEHITTHSEGNEPNRYLVIDFVK